MSAMIRRGKMRAVPTSVARALLWLVAALLTTGVQAQTTVEYIHTDALGSVVAVTDAAGQVIERNDYEPYGAIIGKPSYGGVGFTGHVQDGATGLTYMQQRYYDPQLGLFLSVDPVTAYSDPVGQFHRYRYANNNPYKFVDPDGRAGCAASRIERVCQSYGWGGVANTSVRSPMDFGPVVRRSNYSTKSGVIVPKGIEADVAHTSNLYHNKTGKSLVVTDGPRTPRDQASRIYAKLAAGEDVSRLYRNRSAISDIVVAYRRGGDRDSVLDAMTGVIQNQVDNGVYISSHLRSTAIDFRSRDMSTDDKAHFREAASGARNVIHENLPGPHFHVEY